MQVKILDIPADPYNKDKSEITLNKWLAEHGIGLKIRHIVVNEHFLFIFYDNEEPAAPPYR